MYATNKIIYLNLIIKVIILCARFLGHPKNKNLMDYFSINLRINITKKLYKLHNFSFKVFKVIRKLCCFVYKICKMQNILFSVSNKLFGEMSSSSKKNKPEPRRYKLMLQMLYKQIYTIIPIEIFMFSIEIVVIRTRGVFKREQICPLPQLAKRIQKGRK